MATKMMTLILRKKKSSGKAFKQVRKDEGGTESVASDNDGDFSDSDMSQCSNLSTCLQSKNSVCLYKAEDISNVLQETKGLDGVQAEDFFPDHKRFINDERYLMKERAFQDVEVYCFRKLVNKLKKKN